MNTSSRVLVLIVTLLLCQCLSEVECRRTTSTSRRGQTSRRNNYGSTTGSQHGTSNNSGFFSGFFGSKKPSSSSGSSSGSSFGSSSAGPKKTGTGWTTASQASKTGTAGQSGTWANPYYKPSAPKQPSTYGWVPAGTQKKPDANQFQRSGQPSSNIGAGGYPVQSGFQPAGRTPQQGFGTSQQSHGFNTAQQPHGFNTAQQSHGYNTAQQPHGFNTAQQSHGFNTAQQPHGYNPGSQSHGFNTGQQPHGFNTGQQSHGYNPSQSHGYHPPQTGGYNTGSHPHGYQPSYNQPSYHGNTGGYHPSSNVGPQGFASSHGISPNYYPSQSNFGYPGQGLMGGSHGPKYGGLGLSSGSYGYGGSSWGVPSYGHKSSSGTGKLLTGLALGAAGGYLTSSLVNRVSSPWGYSGWGYGNRYGYDRPIIIKEIRETTKTDTPAPAPAPAPAAEPDPRDNWISCVVFDPSSNQTLINPNCSCTVTTTIDPMTGLPISTHNCTTANGQVLPPVPVGAVPSLPMGPMPPVDGLPPNAVNNPNATPNYGGGLYNDNMRYGAPEYGAPMNLAPYNASPQQPNPPPVVTNTSPASPDTAVAPSSTETPSSTPFVTEDASTMKTDGSTTETMMKDSPEEAQYKSSPKVKEFYSKLEQIVNMGKFT